MQISAIQEMLAQQGLADGAAARRGVSWLLAAQEPDGSWFGRWGANFVYGTGAAVPALIAAGIDPHSEPIRPPQPPNLTQLKNTLSFRPK